jgi:hypothetical protein
MMAYQSTNLPALGNITAGANALGNVVLITPSNQNNRYESQQAYAVPGTPIPPFSDDAFLFHYEAENSISIESDITDHYVEANYAIQDHIAQKPLEVTVQGFIGELNDIAPNKPLQIAQAQVLSRFYALSAYTPEVSAYALLAYNQAAQAFQIAANIANTYQSVKTFDWASGQVNVQNKQQQAFNKLYGYYVNRTLMTVQTPWNKQTNMAIKTLRFIQNQDSRMITDIEITFKKMQFASTEYAVTVIKSINTTGRLSAGSSTGADLGISTPPAAPVSQSSVISGMVK